MRYRNSLAVSVAGLLLPVAGLASAHASSGAQVRHSRQPTITVTGRGTTHGAATMSLGPITVGHVKFSAHRVGSVPTKHVTGHFTGVVQSLPVSLAGPITCLDVKGNSVGFLYPITAAKPAALKGDAVLISVTKGTGGKPNTIGFLGPAPRSTFTSCAPGLTPLTFKGTIGITRKK